ncbi:MAG: hypothetical protein ABSC15_10205 [Terriglobales bacterium]|jgi:hypothetical protein
MKRRCIHMFSFLAAIVFMFGTLPLGLARSSADHNSPPGTHGAVIYVMPNAVSNLGPGDNSQVAVDSSHNGREPQVAKIYQELQRRRECQSCSENMIKEKADYFLLLQHGGGKGNRWALSDKNGDVIASGDSLLLGNSVKDACVAIGKNWQQHGFCDSPSYPGKSFTK